MRAVKLFILILFFSTKLFSIGEEWEKFVKEKYADEDSYRRYDENTPEAVKQFYLLNHTKQTLEFVTEKRKEYTTLHKGKMSIWKAMEVLDSLLDESDPDIHLPQSYHAYQTAEALRLQGYPRWFILTGLIHDLGKILSSFGEPQWAVVGDTFPVGCAYSKKVAFSEYFKQNPDSQLPHYQTKYGIYTPHCGLDQVLMSWGHDEYLYHVLKDYLPEAASYIIRYHSFYAAHQEGAYSYLLNDYDKKMMSWLKLFSLYDLYSKVDEPLDIKSLRPYYEELVREFIPDEVNW